MELKPIFSRGSAGMDVDALLLLADFVAHMHDGNTFVEVFPQNCPVNQACIDEHLKESKNA